MTRDGRRKAFSHQLSATKLTAESYMGHELNDELTTNKNITL